MYDDRYFGELLQSFTLPAILGNHGVPDHVLIMPIPDGGSVRSPRRDPIFNIVLLYELKGFVVQYVSLLNERENTYSGCPNQAHIYVTAWNPNDAVASVDAEHHYSNIFSRDDLNFEHYRSVEDVTELSVTDFYQTFVQSLDICVETPANLWP